MSAQPPESNGSQSRSDTRESWSSAPVMDWLLHKGRMIPSPETLLDQLCRRLVAAGMPLDRVGVFIWTLHPLYFGIRLFWNGDGVQVLPGERHLQTSDEYLASPTVRIRAGERVIRRRLDDSDCELDFPVLSELKEEGMSDYLLVELVFGDGSRNAVSLATRRPGGFSDHDIEQAENLLHVFALLMENFTNHGLATTLLDTYLGTLSGHRVLDGQIKRGDGDLIDAVIWFSDLRDSTTLAERLKHQGFLALLNDYFEATAGAVIAHGGEVLRFIGDASLAVFPTDPADANIESACETAIAAARTAITRASETNSRRLEDGLVPFDYGIGLHLGEVLYGNIGTPSRLEFSVIGPAANETARIEALCKTTNRRVVLSEAVARHLQEDCSSLGQHSLRGVAKPIEVYTLRNH